MFSGLIVLAFSLAISVAFADGKIHANYQARNEYVYWKFVSLGPKRCFNL